MERPATPWPALAAAALALAGLCFFPPLAHPMALYWAAGLLGASLILLHSASPFRPKLALAALALLGLPIVGSALAGGREALGLAGPLALFVAVFCLGQGFASAGDSRERLADGFALILLGQAALAAWQLGVGLPALEAQHASGALGMAVAAGRAWGGFLNPNLLSAFVALVLPWMLACAFRRKGARAVLPAAGAVAGIACLLMGRSVAASAAALAACLLWLFLAGPRGARRAGWAVLAGLALAAIVGLRLRHVEGAPDLQGGLNRLAMWRQAFGLWLGSPWFGLGGGQGQSIALAEAYRQGWTYGALPHNAALQALLATGVAGLAGWLAFLGLAAARALRNAFKDSTSLALTLGVGAWLCCSLADMAASFPETWVPAALALGLVVRPGAARPASGRPVVWAWPCALAAFAALLFRGGLASLQPMAALALALPAVAAGLAAMTGALEPAERIALMGCAWIWVACGLGVVPQQGLAPCAALTLGALVVMGLRRSKPAEPALWLLASAACAGVVLASCVKSALAAWGAGGLSLDMVGDLYRGLGGRWAFPNRNFLAILCAALLLVALNLRASRAAKAALAAVLALGIAWSASRGALLALALGLAWMLWRSARLGLGASPWRKAGLAAGLVAALVLLPGGSGARLADKQTVFTSAQAKDPNAGLRLRMWAHAVQLASDRPLEGHGPGCFVEASQSRGFALPLSNFNPIARFGSLLDYAHQEYLQAVVEAGIPALLFMAVLVGLLLSALMRSQAGPWEVGLEAGVLALMAHAMVDFSLHCLPVLLLALLLIAARLPVSGGVSMRRADAGMLALTGFVAALPLALGQMTLARLDAPQPLEVREHKAMASAAASLAPLSPSAWSHWAQALEIEAVREGKPWLLRHAMMAHRRATLVAPGWAPGREAYAAFLDRAARLPQVEAKSLFQASEPRLAGQSGDVSAALGALALQESGAAVQARPCDVFLRRALAHRLWAGGLASQAFEQLEACVRLEPNFAAAWEDLAQWHPDPQIRASARVSLNKIKLLVPNSENYYEKDLIKTTD